MIDVITPASYVDLESLKFKISSILVIYDNLFVALNNGSIYIFDLNSSYGSVFPDFDASNDTQNSINPDASYTQNAGDIDNDNKNDDDELNKQVTLQSINSSSNLSPILNPTSRRNSFISNTTSKAAFNNNLTPTTSNDLSNSNKNLNNKPSNGNLNKDNTNLKWFNFKNLNKLKLSQKFENISKKPIDQLDFLPDNNYLFILSDNIISIYLYINIIANNSNSNNPSDTINQNQIDLKFLDSIKSSKNAPFFKVSSALKNNLLINSPIERPIDSNLLFDNHSTSSIHINSHNNHNNNPTHNNTNINNLNQRRSSFSYNSSISPSNSLTSINSLLNNKSRNNSVSSSKTSIYSFASNQTNPIFYSKDKNDKVPNSLYSNPSIASSTLSLNLNFDPNLNDIDQIKKINKKSTLLNNNKNIDYNNNNNISKSRKVSRSLTNHTNDSLNYQVSYLVYNVRRKLFIHSFNNTNNNNNLNNNNNNININNNLIINSLNPDILDDPNNIDFIYDNNNILNNNNFNDSNSIANSISQSISNFNSNSFLNELTLTDKCKAIEFISPSKILIALSNDYQIINLKNFKIKSINNYNANSILGNLASNQNNLNLNTNTFNYFFSNYQPTYHLAKISRKRTLISKDINTFKINNNTGNFIKNSNFLLNNIPQILKFFFPYLILIHLRNLEIRDCDNGFLIQSIPIQNINNLFIDNFKKLIFFSSNHNNKLYICFFKNFINQLNQLEKRNHLNEAINLTIQLPLEILPDKIQRLRQLQIKKAQKLFNDSKFQESMLIFSEYLAPPSLIIPLFPSFITIPINNDGNNNDNKNKNKNKNNKNSKNEHYSSNIPIPDNFNLNINLSNQNALNSIKIESLSIIPQKYHSNVINDNMNNDNYSIKSSYYPSSPLKNSYTASNNANIIINSPNNSSTVYNSPNINTKPIVSSPLVNSSRVATTAMKTSLSNDNIHNLHQSYMEHLHNKSSNYYNNYSNKDLSSDNKSIYSVKSSMSNLNSNTFINSRRNSLSIKPNYLILNTQTKKLLKAIRYLLPYLADTRRKINKLINETYNEKDENSNTIDDDDDDDGNEDKFEFNQYEELSSILWKGIQIPKNIFGDLKVSAELVDTTLFKCYIISSPKLIGPLVRIKNYCNLNIVEKELIHKKMFKELIEFYYGKKFHEKALNLLEKLGKGESIKNTDETIIDDFDQDEGIIDSCDIEDDQKDDKNKDKNKDNDKENDYIYTPMLVLNNYNYLNNKLLKGPINTINYLKKLNNDYIELIFKYSKWPITISEKKGMSIFLEDSIESETLNRFKVIEYLLNNFNKKLGIKYLEHAIDNLNDKSSKLHNKLIELYIGIILEEDEKEIKKAKQAVDSEIATIDNDNKEKTIKENKDNKEQKDNNNFLSNSDTLSGYSGNGDDSDDEEEKVEKVGEEVFKKLLKFLKISNYYEPRKILMLLPNERKFLIMKTFVYKKIGEDVKVLEILVNELEDYNRASIYCSELYLEDNKKGQEILHKLLEMYLKPYNGADDIMNIGDETDKINMKKRKVNLKEGLNLLNCQGSRMSSIKILKMLPDELSIEELKQFLKSQLRIINYKINESRVLGSLSKVELVKNQENLLKLRSSSVVINENSTCEVCLKKLSHSVLAAFPDNVVTHYGCARIYKEMVQEKKRQKNKHASYIRSMRR
ncbi:Vam6p ASCRUDRAFT_96178 [Ascoidea rubescens DSM 1968]|uniref:CNH domain-containing protein n=1 Tax=Ascoidea rubescens DSM 1968 TaxID=1344418 RepID=A0A1D2VPD4_9ASCO|nr:hypothetical protein ASCRUDRAFT_96178 [Ascoidea rubescens DSM 1968]ODV63473.1 hypothetical protein ASCRUDRAFT_96178 [Ascoidea rubescens DSM 1968]